MNELIDWTYRKNPERVILSGRYCRLEPLQMCHADQLYAASMADGFEQRYRYLNLAPQSRLQFDQWLSSVVVANDPLFFAVLDSSTEICHGRQALMRVDPINGVIEIGSILWGQSIARTRIATEAFYLMAKYVFGELAYRRLEWKCDADNQASQNAALRFGFSIEGKFRQHMVVKGKNRDTVWFSILDHEWPILASALETWLNPNNFDSLGQQHQKLQAFRQHGNSANSPQ